MLVTKKNERLYPPTWEYNTARVLTELAKIIVSNGGKVKPLNDAVISNRSYDSMKREYLGKIKNCAKIREKVSNKAHAADITNAIARYCNILAELEKVDNTPIIVTHTSYINFVLDGFYYYYEVDDNPFFEFNYIKTPINNGQYSKDACLKNDEKDWLCDQLFSISCSNKDVVESAQFIFNMLVNASPSIVRRDGKKHRVHNAFNSGYHYETIYYPERFGKIDF